MEIPVETTIGISAAKLIENMSASDIAELLNAVALKLDSTFTDRVSAADAFASHTSEIGARFLAEIVALRYRRNDD